MSCLSWNYRGLGLPQKIQDHKMLIQSQKPNAFFIWRLGCYKKNLLESTIRVFEWFHGGKGWSRRGFNNVVASSYGFNIDVWIENWLPIGGNYLTGFYGNWNTTLKKHSWTLLKRIGENRFLSWCIIGDFNQLLYSHETTSKLGRSETQLQAFHDVVSTLELKEILMEGANFTWWSKRKGTSSVYSKLDRCFWNSVHI